MLSIAACVLGIIPVHTIMLVIRYRSASSPIGCKRAVERRYKYESQEFSYRPLEKLVERAALLRGGGADLERTDHNERLCKSLVCQALPITARPNTEG